MTYQLEIDHNLPAFIEEAAHELCKLFGLHGWHIRVHLVDSVGDQSLGEARVQGDDLLANIDLDKKHVTQDSQAEVIETLLHEFIHVMFGEMDIEAAALLGETDYAVFRRANERTANRLTRAMHPFFLSLLPNKAGGSDIGTFLKGGSHD